MTVSEITHDLVVRGNRAFYKGVCLPSDVILTTKSVEECIEVSFSVPCYRYEAPPEEGEDYGAQWMASNLPYLPEGTVFIDDDDDPLIVKVAGTGRKGAYCPTVGFTAVTQADFAAGAPYTLVHLPREES